MGTDEAFADVAAAQDDYIPFDFDDDPFIDQLDGPGPASEAQAVAETKTPKNKQPTVRPDTAPAPRDGRHGQHAPNSDPRGRREPQSKLRSVDVLYPLPVPPWQPEDRVYSKNLLKMLHQEINDYVAFLVPTDAEHIMRQLTVERIRHVVSTIWPHAGVSVFGSFETKLYLPTSDVDIVILEQSIHNPKIALEQLRNAIRQAGIASKIEVISGAKVPILKMVDALTFYPADISFNIATGVDAAKIVRQFIDDPLYGEGLRPLLLIMKQFLLQRNLNEVFTGGIGSYTLMSMITAFLRMHPKLQTGQIHAKDNLGILLMEFLDLYGNRLNYEAVGIGLNLQRAWFFPKAHYSRPGCCPFPRGPPRPNALCILDPQDATNEIGGASRAWPVIRREFIRAYTLLGSMIGAGYEKRQAGRPFNVTTLLGSILTVRRETMEHREKVQQRYESIQENLVDYVIKGTYDGDPVPGQKRKREVTPESTSSQRKSKNHRNIKQTKSQKSTPPTKNTHPSPIGLGMSDLTNKQKSPPSKQKQRKAARMAAAEEAAAARIAAKRERTRIKKKNRLARKEARLASGADAYYVAADGSGTDPGLPSDGKGSDPEYVDSEPDHIERERVIANGLRRNPRRGT